MLYYLKQIFKDDTEISVRFTVDDFRGSISCADCFACKSCREQDFFVRGVKNAG